MSADAYRLAADLTVAVHAAFVLFVMFGGLIVLRRRWVAWLHAPAAAWGIFVECVGWVCPLTPVENYLRERGGDAAYSGDFIARHILPLLYPADLTRGIQIVLGTIALGVNVAVYYTVVRGAKR